MELIIIICILGGLVVTFGYTTFNLLRINKMEDHISFSEKRLQQIDEKGTFKSDDEIGWFFNEIKVLQEGLSQFKTKS